MVSKKPAESKVVLPETAGGIPTVVWQAIIAGIVTIVIAWIGQRASNQVEQVRVDLSKTTAIVDKKLDDIADTSDKTHELVNSASLVQLRLYSVAARRIAVLTKDPADLKAADQAEALYIEHEKKQRKVDQKK